MVEEILVQVMLYVEQESTMMEVVELEQILFLVEQE